MSNLIGGLNMFIKILNNNYKSNQPIFIDDILNLFKDYTRQRVYQLIDNTIQK